MPNLEKPLVSVIVLTYNRKALLLETVDSILKQTYTNFELLIIDNESSDDTKEAIASVADSRIRYFVNPNGGHLAVNRNFGIRQAKGEWIGFCDDDDLWLKDKLEQQIEFIHRHQDTKVFFSNAMKFSSQGNIGAVLEEKFSENNININELLKNDFIPLPTVLVSKDVFEREGLFTEDKRFPNVYDYEFWLRIFKKYRFYYIPHILVRYRLPDGLHQTLTGNKKAHLIQEGIYLFEELLRTSDFPKNQIRKKLSEYYLRKYLFGQSENQVEQGHDLRQAWRFNRFNTVVYICMGLSLFYQKLPFKVFNFFKKAKNV